MALPNGVGSIIDCDIHVNPSSVHALLPYLSEHWREYIAHSDFKGPVDTSYPPGAPTTARPDTMPSSGGPAGSDLALLRKQVLDPLSVELGILSCDYAVDSIRNPDTAAALSRALNDWQAEEWLDREPRLRASVVVPSQVPTLAAEEIDRVGSRRGFVQVFLPARSEAPYGNRRFHPIFEAAVRQDLVVSIHFGGSPGNPPSGAGWPSYLSGGVRRHGPGIPVSGTQHDRGRRFRSISNAESNARREWIHLDAGTDVAA